MAFDIGKEISTQVKTRVFKKVTGGIGDFIRGIPSIGNSGELGKLQTRQKSNVDHFSYPIDVESDTSTGNHGHYILFYINEQDHAKINFGDRDVSGQGSVLEEVKRRKIPNYIREITKKTGYQFVSGDLSTAVVTPATEDASLPIDIYESKKINPVKDLIDGYQESGDLGRIDMSDLEPGRDYVAGNAGFAGGGSAHNVTTYNGINVERAPTKRLKTAISMYMPPDISTSYGVGYSDATIGLFTEQAQQIIRDIGAGISGSGEQASQALERGFTRITNEIFGGGVEAMLTQMLLATADQIPGLGGTADVFGMREGKVFSPRMEVAFRGLEKRKFNYTFKMTPRSSREAEEIRAIIYAFKHNMLPEIDGDFSVGRRMVVPNTFDISYMYSGGGMASENEFLHKISTCVLENMEIKYGGTGKYQTFQGADGGAPVVETTISLSFRELETITRERAREGF